MKKPFLHNICTRHVIIFSVFLVFLTFFLDLYSKYLVESGGNNDIVFNTGVAFGFGSNILIFQFLLPFLIFLIVFGILYRLFGLFRNFDRNKNIVFQILEITGYSLILGGAFGNIYDRLVFGHVRDFIEFPDFWPTYNIADLAISFGVILILISLQFQDHDYNLK